MTFYSKEFKALMSTLKKVIDSQLKKIAALSQVYLDSAATSPLLPEARSTYFQILESTQGNCHSSHQLGQLLQKIVTQSTQTLAEHLKVAPKEIYWTSSATESNNMALHAAYEHMSERYDNIRIFIHPMAHASLREPALFLGGEILQYCQDNKKILLTQIEKTLEQSETACLIALPWGCNETGYLEDFSSLGVLLQGKNQVWLHADAAQSLGKIPLNLRNSVITSMSFSGHKFGAPKAIGALYVKGRPSKNFSALLKGGSQQEGKRSGTLCPALIASFSTALEENHPETWDKIAHLKNDFETFLLQTGYFKSLHLPQSLPSILGVILKSDQEIDQEIDHADQQINKSPSDLESSSSHFENSVESQDLLTDRLCHYTKAKKLLTLLQEHLFFSQSAACSSHLLKTSRALDALGIAPERQLYYCRFSFAFDFDEIFLEQLKNIIQHKILSKL